MSRIVIVGATSGIARACVREWARRGAHQFVLVGRSGERLAAVAADLTTRSPESSAEVRAADLEDPASIGQLVSTIAGEGTIDIALVAHGSMPTQAASKDLAIASESLFVNGVSPVLFAEALANAMESQGYGTLAVIGSVAGDRGRKSNYTYGSAKSMVATFLRGLQHRLAATKVKVVLIKPGPVDTAMTAQLKAEGARLAPVESVAHAVVDGIAAGRRTLYVPGRWAVIMFVVRSLPAAVFNRLNI